MQITIKTSTTDIILEVEPSNTVENIKDNIQVKTGIHPRFQKLFFSNKKLEDGCMLSDYQIENSSCIDFQLIVPCLDEVLDALSTLNAHIDTPTSCTNEMTGSSLEKVTEAKITIKAFVDSHSCCATVIPQLLKSSELTTDRYNNLKLFSESLIRGNCESIQLRNEQGRQIKALELSMQNMQTDLANTKDELANTKVELANLKVANQSIFKKVEVFTKLSDKMEQKIDELGAKYI